MPHEVELHDGLIIVTLYQSQGADEVKKIAQKIVDFSDGKAYDILVDASRVSNGEGKGTPEALRQIKLIKFNRLAIYGPSPRFANQQIKAMTVAAGEPDRIKFFRREEDAREWLGHGTGAAKPYRVELVDDVIEISVLGELYERDVMDLRSEVLSLSEDKPHDVLVDMSGTPADTYIPVNLMEYFESLPFRHYAIYGGSHPIMLPLKELIDSLPENPNLKIFRNEEDAREWLKEESEG